MDDAHSDRLDRLMRALADPTRRRIYDLLSAHPGLTTSQVVEQVAGMTRWGVMKHIAALRDAGLVQTLPEGRRRRHFVEASAIDPLRRWLDGR